MVEPQHGELDDAFGHALMDYYAGIAKHCFIEREDGFLAAENLNHYFGEPSPIELSVKVQGRVLDVGCGAGRHLLHYRSQCDELLGIDRSPLAIEVCKLRGLSNVQTLSLENISTLHPATFDYVLLLGDTFGILGGCESARRVLSDLAKITTAGARIITTTRDPYRTRDESELSYQMWNRGRGRLGGQERIRIRYRDLIDPWMDFLLVSVQEMGSILKGTNWIIEDTAFESEQSRFIAVIRKQKQ
jgi:SAM-dependent methyltransferase